MTRTAIVLTLALVAAPVAVATAQTGPVPRALGTVEVTAGPTPCDGQTCYDLIVTCPEVSAPARARLKVGGRAERGSILFMTGGLGIGLYETGQGLATPPANGSEPEAGRIVRETRDAGFRSIQLQWIDSWLIAAPGAVEGHARLACRSATVARWIADELSPGAGSRTFCATGHSAGGAQTSYMLSHYGLDDLLSAAVITGGPPFGRLDRACSSDPEDQPFAGSVWGRNVMDAGFGGRAGTFAGGTLAGGWDAPGSGPCATSDLESREMFRQASVASGDGDYTHPTTSIAFVIEGIVGMEVAHAADYRDLLRREGTSRVSHDVVPGVEHEGVNGLYNDRDGTDLIRDLLIAECRRHPAGR
ncbi:MAG: hypothetical protein QF634_12670 [Vicinamibacterales bacterium]|jgi:hypothetical protein|nr:hypothetical protein [Acidobacteriota bacterium]MDP6373347.1 hypothetical protein [Vicinamibacterales bacterium]